MNKKIVLTAPVIKVLGVFAALLAGALVLYSMAGMPAPKEADRIGPIDGSFSIIPPRAPGVSSKVIYGLYGSSSPPIDNRIQIVQSVVGGVDTQLFVAHFQGPIDLAKAKENGYLPFKFQGADALAMENVGKHAYIWQTVFQRDGQWYQIQVQFQRKEDITKSQWWPFINSFRCKAVPRSTMPSTIPAIPIN